MTEQVQTPPPAAPQAPTNAAEAATRLNELKADTAWRDRYLAGGLTEQREITSLQEMLHKSDNPDVDRAMAGMLDDAPFQRSGHMQMIGATQMFRDLGIRDEVIRETLTGRPVTQAEHDAVARLKADRDQIYAEALALFELVGADFEEARAGADAGGVQQPVDLAVLCGRQIAPGRRRVERVEQLPDLLHLQFDNARLRHFLVQSGIVGGKRGGCAMIRIKWRFDGDQCGARPLP